MKGSLLVSLCILFHVFASAQVRDSAGVKKDSVPVVPPPGKLRVNNAAGDTTTRYVEIDTVRHKHSPRKATIYSAILPGLGQIYNKKYWKLPLVYAAVGIPIYTFIDNQRWYQRSREAAKMIATGDTANYKSRVVPELYIYFSLNDANSLLQFRNQVRRNMDYSILVTLLMWGLNVVDATVDAHLKDFDISENLSMRIRPTLLSQGSIAGVSMVLTIGNHAKSLSSR